MLQIVAVMVIVIFTTLNCCVRRLSGQIATILTVVKIALILFVASGVHLGDRRLFSFFDDQHAGTCESVAENVTLRLGELQFVGGFAAAMLGALWGYDGWNNLTFVAGEVKDPGRNIPMAIIGSTILIILLIRICSRRLFLCARPDDDRVRFKEFVGCKGRGRHVLWRQRREHRDRVGVAFFTVGLMLSSLGNAAYVAACRSRVPYAMAKDGLIFRPFGKTFGQLMCRFGR